MVTETKNAKKEQPKMSDTMVSLRVSLAERDAIRRAAARRGETVSAFIRRAGLTAAGVLGSARCGSTTHTAVIGARLRYCDWGYLVADRLCGCMPPSQFNLTPTPVWDNDAILTPINDAILAVPTIAAVSE